VTRAAELAEKLNRLNDDRRATEAKALEAIEAQLEGLRGPVGEFLADCIILDDPEWHRGVLGILASRVVDRTGRPALVLTHEDGQAHGSGRSIEGFHLLDALTAVDGVAGDALFTRFGGHAHAVGFSMPSERLGLLRERMQRYGMPLLTGPMLAPPLECDAEALLSELTQGFYDWLERCGPFGIGNREPVFVTRDVKLTAAVRFIKERHICLQLQKDGAGAQFSALGWSRGFEWPARCAEMGLEEGSRVDVAYRLKAKTNPQFPGLELELVDLRVV
jgi:single-stranded-DNA-specific exonuclease